MQWTTAFKSICNDLRFINTDIKFVIAGGSCFRLFNGQEMDHKADIDVFLYDHTRMPMLTDEYIFINSTSKSDDYGCYRYFNTKIKMRVEFIVNVGLSTFMDVLKEFPFNVQRYWWDEKTETVKHIDPFMNEIACMILPSGTSFSDIFQRFTKYKDIAPGRGTTFRILQNEQKSTVFDTSY